MTLILKRDVIYTRNTIFFQEQQHSKFKYGYYVTQSYSNIGDRK